MAPALQEIEGIDGLFAVPPADFVKERNALAKELKGAGEADAAAVVQGLKRPTGPVWAINQLARRHPDEVEAFLEIQSSLASVSAASRLNELAGERRKVVGRLTQLGGKILRASAQTANTQTLQRIGATLLAADDHEEQEAIRLGLLTEELTVSGFGGMSFEEAVVEEASDPADERRVAEEEAEALESEAAETAQTADRLAEEAARLLQEADAAASEAREARKRADELAKDAKSARARLKRI